MNDFLTTYGLWLVIALLALIAVVYLLSRKSESDAPAASAPPIEPVREVAPPPVVVAAVPPAVVDPMPVTPVPEAVIAEAVVPSAATAPVTAGEASDNLIQLKGVGPKLVTLLNELGVTRFGQIAAWTDADLAAVDARLGNFKGRPVRDHWVDQAKYLAAGDVAGFEAKYGKL